MGKKDLERRVEELENDESGEAEEEMEVEVNVLGPDEDPPEDFDPVNNPLDIVVGGKTVREA